MANEVVLRPSYWVSVSGGKDSLYMLILILSRPFSIWQTNPKYNTEYYDNRVRTVHVPRILEQLKADNIPSS